MTEQASSQPSEDASPVDAVAVQVALTRVLRSSTFVFSQRLQSFLRHVVEETLAGRGPELKEYSIGVQVYGRGTSFDPKADSIVRSEARRLRAKLQQYCKGDGANDLLVIELPVGAYRPEFRVPATIASHANHTGPPPPALSQAQREAIVATRVSGTTSRHLRFLALMLVSSALLAAIGWLARRPAPSSDGLVTVLIVPFEQRTTAAVPPGALETVLEFELGRSRTLSVVPRVRIEDTLRLMKRPVDTALTPVIAMEVATRDSGIDTVLSGWIASAGNGYALHAALRDASGGRVLGVTQHPFATAADGAQAAAALAWWVRETLRDTPARQRPEFEPVATSSLAALHAYRRGLELRNESRWMAAESMFAEAVRLDPAFGTALIYYALALNSSDRPRAQVLDMVRKAEAAVAGASERERLFIQATARAIEGQLEESRALYDALIRLYPSHFLAVYNVTQHGTGVGPTLGTQYWTRWADTRPTDPLTAFQAAHWLALQGDDDRTAQRYIDRARQLNTASDAVILLDWLAAGLAFRTGRTGLYGSIVERASAVRPSPTHALGFGVLLLSGGRPRAAEQALAVLDVPRVVHRWSLAAALTRGDGRGAAAHAARLAGTRANPLSTSLLVWAGALAEADAMAARRAESFTPGANRAEVDALWGVADALRLLAKGERSQAAALLRTAVPALAGTNFPDQLIGARALAQLAEQEGKHSDARAHLRRAVADRKGSYETGLILWTACARDLVRLERAGGDTGAADRLQRELGVLLEAAEPDFAPERMGVFPRHHP